MILMLLQASSRQRAEVPLVYHGAHVLLFLGDKSAEGPLSKEVGAFSLLTLPSCFLCSVWSAVDVVSGPVQNPHGL